MNKVINFHEVMDSNSFEEIIIFLKKSYNMIGIEQLIEHYSLNKTMRNICHLTFDDGHRSFYNNAYPVLKKHNIPASVYVSPEITIRQSNFWFQEVKGFDTEKFRQVVAQILELDGDLLKNFSISDMLKCLKIDMIWEIINTYKKKYDPETKSPLNMSVDQILELDKDQLITVGAHTLKHPILANEDADDSRDEISLSINGLADMLNHDITCFAYPNGTPNLDFGEREMKFLKEIDCKISFTTQAGNFNFRSTLLGFPRFGSTDRGINLLRAKLLLGKYWEPLREMRGKSQTTKRNEFLKLMR